MNNKSEKAIDDLKFPLRFDFGLEAIIDANGRAMASTVELEDSPVVGLWIADALNAHSALESENQKLKAENEKLRDYFEEIGNMRPLDFQTADGLRKLRALVERALEENKQ